MPEQPHGPRPTGEAVWQGRLAAPLDPRARRLNDSLPVDGRLVHSMARDGGFPEHATVIDAVSASLAAQPTA